MKPLKADIVLQRAPLNWPTTDGTTAWNDALQTLETHLLKPPRTLVPITITPAPLTTQALRLTPHGTPQEPDTGFQAFNAFTQRLRSLTRRPLPEIPLSLRS